VLAAIMIIVLLPLFAVLAVAVRLNSPGPVIFKQWRHGWNNSQFKIWKFRTMTWEGELRGNGLIQTKREDPRVTRVGKFLRQSSLDELPQLFNVLRGEMSLVGPRPHMVVMRTEDLLGEDIIAEYSHRHRVKPGITGWAQVNGMRGATHRVEQMRKRVELDLYYIENWSIVFDIKILLMTPFKLLFDRSNAY
jgi:lipopolysaccharide/colanic/teichoic acid biosynthesis glycosyltransferase